MSNPRGLPITGSARDIADAFPWQVSEKRACYHNPTRYFFLHFWTSPMCSIFGIFGLHAADDISSLRTQALERSQSQRHRGPDWSGVHVDGGAILVHERLAIVDPNGGAQPLLSEDGQLALAVNGEIYNHRELKASLTKSYAFKTQSDCEVINALYLEAEPATFIDRLNGIFGPRK